MNDDIVEMVEHRCLFRQSSVEVHLTPETLEYSSESDNEKSNNETEKLENVNTFTPKIIAEIPKSPRTGQSSMMMKELKNKLEGKRPEIARKPMVSGPKSPNEIQVLYTEVLTKPRTSLASQNQLKESSDACVYAEIVQSASVDKESQKKSSIHSELEEKLLKLQTQTKLSTISNNEGQNQHAIKQDNGCSDVPEYAQVIKKSKGDQIDQEKTGLPQRARHAPSIYENVIQTSNVRQSSNATQNEESHVKNPEETVEQPTPKDIGDIKAFDTAGKMATLRPKSPRPPVVKPEKEESLWDKLGTLGRKKRIKEVKEVEAEGKNAIDSPGNPVMPDYPPEEYELDENEERCMVNLQSLEQPKVKDLIQILIDWINDELAEQRIIVQDIVEDLYDGQVLQKLLEKLTGDKLNEPEVTQSEAGQKHKLAMVLDDFNRVLGIQHQAPKKWGVEAIHSKNIVAILYLLVALARHFRAPIRLPEHVTIVTHVVQKSKGQLVHRTVHEHVTSAYDDVGMRCERDAFDTLFDHAPDKLQVVKKSMVTFVNKHLNKINLEVTDLDTQFSDGVYLVLLMGLLEGFFVPLHCFFLTPKDFDQKVHNVAFAFELMEEVGISRPKARPEDIVNLDLKSTLRVLYKLFTKYRDIM